MAGKCAGKRLQSLMIRRIPGTQRMEEIRLMKSRALNHECIGQRYQDRAADIAREIDEPGDLIVQFTEGCRNKPPS